MADRCDAPCGKDETVRCVLPAGHFEHDCSEHSDGSLRWLSMDECEVRHRTDWRSRALRAEAERDEAVNLLIDLWHEATLDTDDEAHMDIARDVRAFMKKRNEAPIVRHKEPDRG